nr:heme-binding protein [Luteolibacter marinus]
MAAGNLHAGDPAAAKPGSSYVDEAPLPKGWPEPGPYGKVVEKQYPAYRAAFTNGKGETSAFWTLFTHIKKHDIPMTAPVEMTMDGDNRQTAMAFLYQNGKVGTTGPDGAKVEVKDVPASTALSYTWQGSDSKENISKARTELEAVLGEKSVESKGFRLLGYNGPGTPREKRTWELQAVID